MATQTKENVAETRNFDHIVNDVCIGPNCGSIDLVGSVVKANQGGQKEEIIELLVDLEMTSEDA